MRARISRTAVIATIVLAGASLAACGPAEAPTPSPVTSSVEPSPKTEPPTPVVPPEPTIWPLTGVEAPADAPVRPALSVKIENSTGARPQTGLDAADIVWEEIVEGGIARYIAVYHSQVPDVIGPVRSVRPMDPNIVKPMGGLFAFSGGQAHYVAAVEAAGIQVLSNDAGAGGFYRSNQHAAPHNVFANTPELFAQADANHSSPPPQQFEYGVTAAEATAVTAGAPAAVVDVLLTGAANPNWTWDAARGQWLRAEKSVPATTPEGTQLGAANVIVLKVNLVDTPDTDAAGTHVPETIIIASGEGLVASGGQTLPVTWSKTSADDLVHLTGPDGQPVLLAPGITWIELMPSNGHWTVG